MKPAILLIPALLSGCGVLFADNSRYDRNSQAFKQCSYEAKVATPSNLGALETVAREQDLIDACMKARGL